MEVVSFLLELSPDSHHFSFIYFIQQTFDYLWCARYFVMYWEGSSEHNGQPWLSWSFHFNREGWTISKCILGKSGVEMY